MTETDADPVEPIVGPVDRERAFREAVAKLCDEHGAKLEVKDDGRPYGMHNGVLTVTMISVWDGDRLVKDFCEFNW